MARALELESQRWTQDVAPQRLDGRCHSELAIDVIQVARLPLVHERTSLRANTRSPLSTVPLFHVLPTPTPAAAPALDRVGPCSVHLTPADHLPGPGQGREHHP